MTVTVEWEHAVGDRVTRPVNVFWNASPIRTGTVTRCYTEWSMGHFYEELYEVTWDHENGKRIEPLVCVGYLAHGITKAPQIADPRESKNGSDTERSS